MTIRRKRGQLSYITHIPGGKRFWKVGRLYKAKAAFNLYPEYFELAKSSRSIHRRYNIRWLQPDPFTTKSKQISKNTIILLLSKPKYLTNKFLPLEKIDIGNYYQIQVLCNENIGWIHLSFNKSPRCFFSTIK